MEGKIVRVAGPLVVAKGLQNVKMYEMVRVGELKLFGEIIGLDKDIAYIQVYEETQGIGPGEPVYPLGEPLSVELGPGIVGQIYDGIQRPLSKLAEQAGDFLSRGLSLPALDRNIKWDFEALVKPGDEVVGGDILGVVQETSALQHRILVPPNLRGKILDIKSGSYTIEEPIGILLDPEGKKIELKLMHKWPVRYQRPVREKIPPQVPLITGQRVLDTFFPVVKGGTACVPGPFGSGKTIIQHQLAKWADADVIVYVGCGERGNEMTEVLIEFPELTDPRTGKPLMERTILIANTSNMPVAAREASVFTGITIAEYFRDMGYNVALMADSTSRWAEAMREISGRLAEMPGEEGYPAYLASRIASFYERAGYVKCMGSDERTGSVSIIGAVSPPGGDLSDPVVQATLRVVKVFWGLDASLAFSRHFPAVNWLISYSLYLDVVKEYWSEHVSADWYELRQKAMSLLQREAELQDIVRLVGMEALSPQDRLVLETARSIREDFLHQNALHEVDTYTSPKKQYLMLKNIMNFYTVASRLLEEGVPLQSILTLPEREKIARMKFVSEGRISEIEQLIKEVEEKLLSLKKGAEEVA
ncbi:MAG: V-type ATP synthase alpha chain [Thermotoga sp. 50_1627]|uniref:V-type ATP synthase subunit A n=1 Tax=Pseudothermotoga sp. TaxID=2033661 RepID=UPI00076D1AEB|nr:MAG: V-type ATP synthase alpha chain [Thermotoga sp. 50_64]KUK25836.1 MAG: V-type ATP synthase alpha chain [Thermotoga sp. 50_1627]MBC7115521.1 V-type ATP synthase subunit A [Pseudothermotoga sp.]HBT40061.1 V-type ATP synthase subunit A [Pseudothermotoga sp.]HCO98906.1 V-type ATP synthase subunit A [Pseudothermotoga sp.]